MKKSPNIRLIRGRRSYNASEISELLQVRQETVRNWRKAGLIPLNPGERPIIFMGCDLIAFHKNRQKKRKCKLRKNELYCLRCKTAVHPTPGSVQIVEKEVLLGKDNRQIIIKGECQNCGCLVNRFTSTNGFTELEFDRNTKMANEGLEGDQFTLFERAFNNTESRVEKTK